MEGKKKNKTESSALGHFVAPYVKTVKQGLAELVIAVREVSSELRAILISTSNPCFYFFPLSCSFVAKEKEHLLF